MKKLMNLHIFDEGASGAEGASGNAGGKSGNNNGGSAGYTFEQAEEIATSRAEKATRAALADFYRKQGLSEEQITTAIADFKAKQKAQQPDVELLTRERDEARKKLQQYEQEKTLINKGVKNADLDYVMFKVSKLVDEKTDFAKAAEKFLKENPRYTGAGTYRVSTSTGSDNQNSGGNMNMTINDRIRAAAKR